MLDKLNPATANVTAERNDFEVEAVKEAAASDPVDGLRVNCLNLEEEELEDDSELIVRGLSSLGFDSCRDDTESYLAKGPVFRRNDPNQRPAPYTTPTPTSGQDANAKGVGVGVGVGVTHDRIPYLPDTNVSTNASTNASTNVSQPHEGYVKNVDQFYNAKHVLSEPRLFLKKSNGELHALAVAASVTLEVEERILAVRLPRMVVPEDARMDGGHVQVVLQPNARDRRYVSGRARVVDDPDARAAFVEPQRVSLSPFDLGGLSSVGHLLEGLSEEDVTHAVALVRRQDPVDLLKTYGPNNDTLLMALCCKGDDAPSIRAQVFALCARILTLPDPSHRQNVVLKNDAGLSALDYATVTNNARVAVFLAELFYVLGQDILGRDNSGNTIIHVMARKGDSVSSCLEALFGLTFRHEGGGKVYSGNVVNSKHFLPIHIAAMSPKVPQNTLRILKQDYEHGLDCRTSDGSLPLHLACQYSTDPNLLITIIGWNKGSSVDERRNDGFTPLHLVAARNDEKDVKVGLIPLEENIQLQMLQVLLENGANKNLTVENYKPVDLLKPTRTQAINLLRMDSYSRKVEIRNPMMSNFIDSPNSLTSGSPLQVGGDHSPIAPNCSPSFGLVDPFQMNDFYNSDVDSSPNMGNQWQSSPYKYHYSPGAHIGSVSSGVESQYSDESDEDNNSRADIDAIAQVLIGHPTIQAAIEAATRSD